MDLGVIITFFVVINISFGVVLTFDVDLAGTCRNDVDTNRTENFLQRKWISQLFRVAETNFRMDSTNVSAECRRDFAAYLQHLNIQSVWAIRMMESSEWPAVGVFAGMVDHLGNYDECLRVSMYRIEGQYCLVQVKYDYPNDLPVDEIEEIPNEGLSAWDAIKMYEKNPVRVDRKKLKFALCIPSSCSMADLEISLNGTLYPLFKSNGLNVSVQVEPKFCKTHSEHEYSREHYVARWFFIALFFLVMLSTYCDTTWSKPGSHSKENRRNMLSCICEYLSITRNFAKLRVTNPKADIPFLHFGKTVLIISVIFSHRLIYFYGFPKFNTEGVERLYKPSSFAYVVITHINLMDVFFMVNGFIKFHFGLASMTRRGSLYYVFVGVLLRWMRMVPVFCILSLYVIYILPYTGDGPLWDDRITTAVSRCKEGWLTNFLAISNIVNTDQQCVIISWYISVDIQLTIIGGILLFIYAKNKKAGIIMSIVAFAGFAMITFIVAYWNRYNGIIRFLIDFLEDPVKNQELTDFHISTYTRAGAYLIGFMAGIIIKTLKETKFKFSVRQALPLCFVTLLISVGIQQYSALLFVFNRGYNRFENAILAAVCRSLFMSVFAVELILNITSKLGIFSHKFFHSENFVPFGRLTYSVFLLNFTVMMFHASSQKQIMPTSGTINWVWWATADVVWCYLLGLVVYLFVEAPIANFTKALERVLLRESNEPKIN